VLRPKPLQESESNDSFDLTTLGAKHSDT